MTPRNAYATLADYHAYATARGQTATASATDDGVIELLLEAASRYIEDETQRRFIPFVQTRYFAAPDDAELDLDEDLLEVVTLTNGDGASIASTEYNLTPRNMTPHYALALKNTANVGWSSFDDDIALLGFWGYHNEYGIAWKTATTAAEAIDSSETEIDVTSASPFSAGMVVRVDNELMLVTSTATGKINVERGHNGSTAAAHDNGALVKIYNVMTAAKMAVLEIAVNAYKRRFGQSQSNTETITAAGVVLTPRDIPKTAAAFIIVYRERL